MEQLPQALSQALWPHQKDAIAFAYRRLRADGDPKTLLVRMPTGTGKTGVIASLSLALPPLQWILILTPWDNLCGQLIEDLRSRFWEISSWRPEAGTKIERLYPSNAEKLLSRPDQKIVLVATFATLVTLFRDREGKQNYQKLAAKLSETFVDEGHYEPAVEWGQAVKQLNVPTLLLTATPYRNDLKLFRVRPDDMWQYTHKAAVDDGIIRLLTPQAMNSQEPKGKRGLSEWCDEFASYWLGPKKRYFPSDTRAIIYCSDMATVKATTSRLRRRGINAVGIHERFGKEQDKWLFQRVPNPRNVSFDVWVHQNKLTEGLDDNRFRVLAVMHRIRNDRKLVQQVGRVLRKTKEDRWSAVVMYSSDLQVERSWNGYLEYEVLTTFNDPLRYRKVLDALLKEQPPMEYFDGQFRRRFDANSTIHREDIRLLPSVLVRRVETSFNWQQCAAFISDYLLLEDCILLGPEEGYEVGDDDSRLWTYAMFSNSSVLISRSHYEIRLGAMAAVVHNGIFFLSDTEARFPDVYLPEHTRKIPADVLGRVLDRASIPHEVSLLNAWPTGPIVRRANIHANDLAATSPQLTDSIFLCSGVRATVPALSGSMSRRHYVGFSRGRLSEQIQTTVRNEFSLDAFAAWSKGFAASIESQHRKLPEFFSRYLVPTQAPTPIRAAYLVLNLLAGEVELETSSGQMIEVVESIIELAPAEANPEGPRYKGIVRFSLQAETGEDEHEINFELTCHWKSGRFFILGEELNSNIFVNAAQGTEQQGLQRYLNHYDERFTIAMAEPDIFYNGGGFYKIDYSFAERRLTKLLTHPAILDTVTTEKGDVGHGRKNWDKSSLFGVIDRVRKDGLLATNFPEAELVFCDDLNAEVADFVSVSFTERRIALIHAKHGSGNRVSASALHVVVAQALKNLGILSRSGPTPPKIHTWNRQSTWGTSTLKRWRHGARSLPENEELWARVRSEILDHPDGQKEVWLVLGDTLVLQELIDQVNDQDLWTPITGQVIHLLSSLNANCSQLQIKLRVFCN